MTTLDIQNSLLLIIDMQEKLLNAVYNKFELSKKVEILAMSANTLEIPCIITEQYPKGLGSTVGIVKDNLTAAKYFEKTQFNAISNDDISQKLIEYEKKQIIIAGIETHICVRQTAYGLLKSDYDVSIINDCCSSRSEDEHKSGIALMKDEGCFIKTLEIVLFELLKDSKHPKFKEIQALIK